MNISLKYIGHAELGETLRNARTLSAALTRPHLSPGIIGKCRLLPRLPLFLKSFDYADLQKAASTYSFTME